MKKTISSILSTLLIIMMIIPAPCMAEENEELQRAIQTVREKFDIPDIFTEFNYNVNTENGKNVWHLSWNSKDGLEGSMSVNVDEEGTVRSYYFYKPYDYSRARKLPKISRQEAKVTAEDFIKKINPGLLTQIKLADYYKNTLMERTYNFHYVRLVNGIPFYNNNVEVQVNNETGDVQRYYYNWSDDLVFPAPDDIITLEEAQKAYMDKLGLKLIYNYISNHDTHRTYAVYVPVYGNNCCIDAFTGDKLEVDYGNYSPYYGSMSDQGGMMKKARMEESAEDLTPEELKAVDEVSKLKTKDEAEKIARDVKVLELTDDFKLARTSLRRDWTFKQDFTWDLNFIKEVSDKEEQPKNVSVRLDAKTGKIKSFYRYVSYEKDSEAGYDEEDAKAAAVELIKELHSAKADYIEYDDTYKNHYQPEGDQKKPVRYRLRYIRKGNGIQFPTNSMRLEFDAVNGKIFNFNMNWYDVEFPSLDNVVLVDDVYEKMFSDVGLELQYKTKYIDEIEYKYHYDPNRKPDVKLVYGIKPGKPLYFDANTGQMLDNSGKPYKENKPVEYTDISGNFAEKQIKILAEYGIALEAPEFNPDQSISQKDFLILLAKTINYYTYRDVLSSDDKEIEELYNYLIREGIVKKDEKAPDAVVTREESVKLIIRALKYDKVADLKGIYKTSFKDEDKINPDLIGYVSIARGLKIINGNNGYFNPTDKLTRAQAAIIIYNYLNR